MNTEIELGTASDHELRDLIARTLVRESAQAAGLEVASPYGEGLGGRLLMFGEDGEPGAPVRGRWVQLGYRGYEDLVESPPLVLKPGELLAVHDVADAQPEAVYLLTADELSRMSSDGWVAREMWRATRERWRGLVLT